MRFFQHNSLARHLSLLLVGLFLAACSGQAQQSPAATGVPASSATSAPAGATSAPASATTIRLGYVPVMIYAPLFVAQERGYFSEEGLKVELTPLQGGSDSVVQLAAGNFDAAVGGAGAGLLNAAARGVKFTIVAPMHQERPPLASPLVISAKRTSEIKSVADLKGKKVAINATGAATEYWLAEALKKANLTFDDIQLVALPFRDVPAALENGSLDASILGEPLATINKQKGIVSVLADDFVNGFTATYLYMGEPLLTKNPEAAKGFVRAYLRACRDLQGSYMTPEVAQIIEKYTQVPAAVVQQASLPQYDPTGKVPLQDLQTLQTYFLGRGELEYKEPLDLTAFVNTQIASQAVAELDAK